jgi:hypothetical protein
MRIMSFAKILVVTLAFVSAAALPWSVPAASAVQRTDQLVRAAILQQRHAGPGPALFRSVVRGEMRELTTPL